MISEHNKLFDISIHAPRERSDGANTSGNSFNKIFQSTLLVRGATIHASPEIHASPISIHAPRERSDNYIDKCEKIKAISIHAPRERSDLPPVKQIVFLPNFNPRSS